MWILRFIATLAVAFAAPEAGAQRPHHAPRPPAEAVALLNLDAQRAQQVAAILENTHARMEAARQQIGPPTDATSRSSMHAAMTAIREETDKQLAAVLTAEELAKLKAATRPPGPPPGRPPA